jgi:uncharacterized protein YecE (DUF72 family)
VRGAGTGARLRVGCSGWSYPHWRERVYPRGLGEARWLQHYATLFDTVEVNATFYRLPATSTVERWVRETPEEFCFAVKGSRYLTHVRRLRDLGPGLGRFYERLEPLVRSPKLGPVLWQLPERFARDDERLGAALAALPPGEHAFEFRHPSWFAEDVYALLREYGAALVIGDAPGRPFQTRELTAAWTYLRFHEGARGRRGNYAESELREWARWLGRPGVRGYAYFNNDQEGFAVANALRLLALLAT